MVIIVMGVAGSGKTTVGQALADDLGWEFRDADPFHPPSNIAKMEAGQPLTDEDRWPWLRALRAEIERHLASETDLILACSALKRSYRDLLVEGHRDQCRFVYLQGDFELFEKRLRGRNAHFMKEEMLKSQFAALEPPRRAVATDASQPPEKIVNQVKLALGL